MKKNLLIISILAVVGFLLFSGSSSKEIVDNSLYLIKSEAITKFFKTGKIPHKIKNENSEVLITSTINNKLQKRVELLLRRYRSDYSAVVVIDNETGHILATTGYEGRHKKKNYHLSFSSTHPSASLFKIVTTAKLLEEKKVNPNTKFQYRGKGTTLYKYQLKDKKSRWTRSIPFRKAFAYSNNVIFGKAAVKNLTGIELFNMAYKFGFNRDIFDDMELNKSTFQMPQGSYNLAELASGFNSETMISPIHAASMSMLVANKGNFIKPTLFNSIYDDKHGNYVKEKKVSWRAFGEKTALDLRSMMNQTITKGTARGSFRKLKKSLKRELEIGGKTGSLTGGMPVGKRDWFTSYASPRNLKNGKGISIAVMNINVKKWYVKSAFLAKEIISYYFTKVKPIKNARGALVAQNK